VASPGRAYVQLASAVLLVLAGAYVIFTGYRSAAEASWPDEPCALARQRHGSLNGKASSEEEAT
jgi:hypothetical protein